ncbi:MAG: hypothetical protein JW839_05345 [Candidatus Lokiarchaeota archaeon]|nr:hypothetical protein [Candidatus Lokiarchaeota archaeon]
MRCPTCGNDITSTQYSCHVCNAVLVVEALERHVGFLARHEERWRKPMKFWERVKWMLVRPSRAMWDIVHKPTDDGGAFALFGNMLLFGLVGVVLFNKSGAPAFYPSFTALFMHGLAMYAMFAAIGFLYFVILWGLIIIVQTIAVKYALNIAPRWGTQLPVMYWAFVPALLCTGLYVAILALGLPQLSGATTIDAIAAASIDLFFNSRSLPVWIAADVVQIAFYFGYLSILLAIAYREYYDKSTTRALVATIVTSVIGAVVFVMTRSTFG